MLIKQLGGTQEAPTRCPNAAARSEHGPDGEAWESDCQSHQKSRCEFVVQDILQVTVRLNIIPLAEGVVRPAFGLERSQSISKFLVKLRSSLAKKLASIVK